MNITVTKTQVSVDTDYILNDKEYNVNQCYFTFSEEYTNDLVKKAIFVQGTSAIEMSIINNQCQIPAEVLNNGQFELRVYAYEVDGDELLLRYSPSYTTAYVRTGSYIENAESPEVITPTQFEQYMQAMNDGLNEVANVDIDAEQLDNGMSVTITNRYGEDKTVYAYDGEKGETGATPNIQIGTVVTGDHSEVTRTGTNENPIFNFVLEKGDKGDTGNGIASVTKTSTSGLVDTYTITYTNGTTTTFDVTNGKGIDNISKTSTSGLEDTYTITYNDNTTSTFTVTNGNGISSIEKTGTQDNVDTYTIYYTNGTTSTFTVTNSTVTNQEFEELKAEHEELVNTLPRVEGTGESITLDNTAQYKMNVALNPTELSQTTYTGRNKANFETIEYRVENDATVSRSGQEYTITCSANNRWGSCRFSVYELGLKLNTTYTFSALIKSTTSSTGSYAYVYAGATSTGTATAGSKAIAGNRCYITFTTPASWGSNGYQVGLLPTEAGATTVFTDIMIEESSTMGEFEPYVGGVPSPNPLYPQPIKKVTGNNSITVCGKNRWGGFNSYSRSAAGIDFVTNSNGTITANGTATSTTYSATGVTVASDNVYTVLEAGTYILNIDSLPSGVTYQLSTLPENSTTLNILLNGTTLPRTFTLTEKQRINVRIVVSSGTILNNVTFKVMMNKGETSLPFEPYQSQTYPINLGANLFDKDSAIYDNSHYKNDSGTVSSSSSSGYTTSYVGVKPKEIYTIDGVGIARIYHYDNSKNWVSRSDTITLPYTFTTPNDCYYIQFQYTVATYDATKVMIEEGTSASYKPYGTPAIEYCKIGDYSDEFYLDNGNWYIRRNIGKYTFTGSETGSLLSNNDTTYLYNINGKTFNGVSNYSSKYYNNYSIANSTTSSTSNTNLGSYIYNHTFRMRVPSTIATTYELFQTWLANANNIIYYPLETPTSEAITDTTLINQLNNLYNQIKSYKGQTNITQTKAELPFNIDASALYDLNNLISRVATLEVEV